MVKKYNLQDEYPVIYPTELGVKLVSDSKEKSVEELNHLSKITYQNAIGSLIYLLQSTHPDIAYAVSYLSRFNTCYNQTHWNCVKKLIRYLKGISDLALTFTKGENFQITGFYDASYAPVKKMRVRLQLIFLKNKKVQFLGDQGDKKLLQNHQL